MYTQGKIMSTSWYSKPLPSGPNLFFQFDIHPRGYPSTLRSCHVNPLSFLSPPRASKSFQVGSVFCSPTVGRAKLCLGFYKQTGNTAICGGVNTVNAVCEFSNTQGLSTSSLTCMFLFGNTGIILIILFLRL